MATPQVKDLVLRSPAGSSEVVTFSWPLQVGSGQDKHDNGIDIIDTIKFVCEELPGISSAFEEINLNQIDTACYKTMTNLVDRFNKAVDSIVALEKGTSLPAERLNKFAHPSLLRHILQLVYNAAVLDPDKLNNYEPFSPEVYGETSYELVQQMIKHVHVTNDDTFIDLGSGVGQVVLQMAGSFPLKTCIGIEKADTPARYAERMDAYFRQFMAWFGKRYCDYKLLKGDFLVDEHREKITSSSLVFVNNFAFGPNVDHQLKERFADLRDGARIVSSKSFCPLNFRITDRNLSDIGTIMHVSEIPPLKGSVSWTCKPVSYYLHVIDRTILERYFQRLKTQKGAEHEHVGSTRTTRDRAKREANNHAAMNQNSNSNSVVNRTNSPATVNNHATANSNSNSSTKTRQQQHMQQQQQQRSLDMDSSSESDGDGTTANGSNSTGGHTNGSGGPTTRKVWSDWCSSKGKSSQSDDEENNNFSSTTNSRNARATTQKKRKKLTRKAAIASKSAAAAQREAAARDREAASVANSKESSSKEDGATGGQSTGPGKGRKGRLKKGPGRGKKSLKIVGLDVLHKQTLLSTSVEVMSKKLPAAPGCVDQQLTSLLTGDMSHTELEIPIAPQNTPYALQILLDVFRTQYMSMIEQMKSKSFVPNIKRQIQIEQERKQRIKNRASQLDKQIKVLIDDSVALLKVRMNELGINVSSPNDLIAKAKEIVGRHKELQGIAKKIQSQVTACELEEKRLLKKNLQHLPEYQKLYGNGKTKPDLPGSNGHDLSEAAAHELILKEIANTLAQRKKLYAQVSNIEKEATALEKAAEERRTAAALLAQGTNMTVANLATTPAAHAPVHPSIPATITPAAQPLQLTSGASISVAPSAAAGAASTKPNNHAKASRRSRDHRTRSQEWPDVPDVGKIEESNPEVLAQKILETGRQIEAGKFTATTNYNNNNNNNNNKQPPLHCSQPPQAEEKRHKHHRSSSSESVSSAVGAGGASLMGPHDSALMPAPPAAKNQSVAPPSAIASNPATALQPTSMRGSSSILPKCELPGSRKAGASNIQESPKVANFEDRLKSIITSALNEDQEHRKAQHQLPASGLLPEATPPSPQQSPAPKRSKHAAASAAAAAAAAAGSTQHLPPPPPQAPNNLSNIITVATQGLTHLNATTTISPITPPLPLPPTAAAAGPYAVNAPQHYGKYGKPSSSSASSASAQKYAQSNATAATLALESAKYHHHQGPPPPGPAQQQQQQQQHQHLNHMQQMHQSIYAAAAGVPADLAFHRRRSSISAASSYEHFAAQQQQHQQALMMAAAAAAAQHQQPLQSSASSSSLIAPHSTHPGLLPLEFKAPNVAENLMSSSSTSQRSSSRELLDEPIAAPRSSSANSDSAVMYFPPTRDRLMSLERSTSRESAVSQPLPPHQQPPQPSRPSSNSSQPDYTQVSPAKMALRRHLSQEKLNQQHPAASAGLPLSKTIGDLVNGEIERSLERTLEISHQSIINAVVNMSTVGSVSGAKVGGGGGVGGAMIERSSYGERAAGGGGGVGVYGERDGGRDRERTQSSERPHERLLINPNAQRPERVHVRVLDEHGPGGQHGGNNYPAMEISPRCASGSGRKSPGAHNLSTLAHVAYNHKAPSGGVVAHDMGGGAISLKMSAASSPANGGARGNPSVNNYNHQHRDSSAPYHHHLPSSSTPSSTSSATVSAASATIALNRGPAAAPSRREYQAVALPRAEMKGCIEAYFNEEQQHQHQHHQPQQQQQQQPKSAKERPTARNGRINGGNAPLEGLAASLQDHVMASRKFKEENEERQRRAAVAASTTSDHYPHQHLSSSGSAAAAHQSYQSLAAAAQAATPTSSTMNHNGSPIKVEIGHKRTSPVVAQHPRPSKIAHYSHEAMQHPTSGSSAPPHHPHPLQHQQSLSHNALHGLHAATSSTTGPSHLMMPSGNPYANVNGNSLVHSSTANPTTPITGRRAKMPMEPLLMSPEINSIMGDEPRPLQLSSRQQHQTTPIVGGRTGDDDDVIPDDESHWQHRVSSGFDRLVAFASTELDKTRRSIDTDTVPSSISCNTSPDSGITHSSSNSDAARTFLSTSSTSSQMDMPIGGGGVGVGGSFGSYNSHHHHVGHASDHLSDSSIKSSHSADSASLAITLKTTTSSPADASAIESPSLSDIGLPRTPSPNAAVATPPLAAATIAASKSSVAADAGDSQTATTTTASLEGASSIGSNTLKIPLKYQRKSKSSSEKHYKKKFCERNWEYDCDELMAYSSSSSATAADAAGTTNGGVVALEQEQLKAKSPKVMSGLIESDVGGNSNSGGSTGGGGGGGAVTEGAGLAPSSETTNLVNHNHHHSSNSSSSNSNSSSSHHHHHHHHKSSKFRPKGKDWDWSHDSGSKNKASVTTAESATTNVN